MFETLECRRMFSVDCTVGGMPMGASHPVYAGDAIIQPVDPTNSNGGRVVDPLGIPASTQSGTSEA